jgi:hypothetical protein
MSQLNYPISPDALLVQVLVGLKDASIAALVAAGLSVPPPLHAVGSIDTGSDVTCVASHLLAHFRTPVAYTTTTTTASGTVPVNLYEVSLSIAPAAGQTGSLFVHPRLLVMELPQTIPSIDVLIGRDVILQCQLFVDGPGNGFSLSF